MENSCGVVALSSFAEYKRYKQADRAGNRIDSEESKQQYRNSQKLRAMERAIRRTKTQLLVKQKEIDMVAETDVKSILQEGYDKLAYNTRYQNQHKGG